MADVLEDHVGTVSIRGGTITNLRSADDIGIPAGQQHDLVNLVNQLDEASTTYGIQISAEKTDLVTNSTNGSSTDITIDNKKLGPVHSFKYLGATVLDKGSKPEVLSRITLATAAMTKLKVIWNDKAIELRFFRKLLGMSYRDHLTKEEARIRIENAVGWYEDFLTSAKRRNIKWYGHVTRTSGLAKTVQQETVQRRRRRGRQRKREEDNIRELTTGLEWNIILRKAENREERRKLVVKSLGVPRRSARQRDR